MIVTVSARLSGKAFVATSRVSTSVTTSPNLFRLRVFWLKSIRSACSLSFGPKLRGFGARTCSPRRLAGLPQPAPK